MGTKAPEAEVTIAGKKVGEDLTGHLVSALVCLDMDDESSAVIEIDDVYDLEAGSLAGAVSGSLKPGCSIEVFLGYAGDKAKVFTGYLERIELDGGESAAPILRLYAFDAIRLMKNNYFSRIIKQKKHSAVVSEVMNTYSWLGITVSCDETDAYDKARCWYQNGTDYDFVKQEMVDCCPNDREFYLSLGTAYYQKPDLKTAVLSLTYQDNSNTFRAGRSYVNQTIQVFGSSPLFQPFTASKAAADPQIDSSAKAGMTSLLIADADSQDIAGGIAGSRAAKLLRRTVRIRLELDGNNLLQTGTFVTIRKIDPLWNGTYRVRKALHSYTEKGYLTTITVEGS